DIDVLTDQLWNDVDGDTVLFEADPVTGAFIAYDPGDTGLLTQIPDPANAFTTADLQVTVAEGALFNVRLVGEARYGNGDRSKGVHNPFLSTGLLAASINAVEAEYFAAAAVRLSPEAQAVLDRVNAKVLRGRAPSPISSR
ncbi:MAG TPA: hypothetical protein VFV66_09735, partial [Nonomuraea sp.]|nr:hypothetical protein [Nonomuraea sp.]